MVSRNGNYYFKCRTHNCTKTFSSLKELNYHHLSNHKKVKLLCAKCPCTFMTPSTFRAHISTAHSEKRFECSQCQMKFAFASAHRFHHLTHLMQKLHCCFAAGCNKAYKWPQDLDRHLQKHLKAKWNCKDCGETFFEKRLLHRHQAVHRPNNVYWCKTCDFGCKWYTQMSHHQQVCLGPNTN